MMSYKFSVKSGVRQGGVLSPMFFNISVNNLLVTLRSERLSCYIKHCYLGCIMYADDLLLLAASVTELQNMLNVCSDIGDNLGI